MSFFDNYVSVNCRECNGSIILMEQTYKNLVQSGRVFYCLGGHKNQYLGEEEKLRKALADMTTYRDNAVAHRERIEGYWQEEKESGKRMARRIASLQGWVKRLKKMLHGNG